ncbi:3-oxoacyl-ACP reductase [Enterococcus thailandicus]|uniref:3-oxoacyl-ACP reductase n=2 Tax=Enterococcus TaxID=1350 RepID=A0A510WG15_ENTTH|nr:3-oxoacyl-ACP reductase [Enterococcus thailandicus]
MNMNKVALITGGTKGIGRGLVETYLLNGYSVATFSSEKINTELLRETYADFPEDKLHVKTLDIRNEDLSRKFVREVIEKFGRIDTYIFNAGICQDKSFGKMTGKDWTEVISVNFTSAFGMTQEVFRQMKKQTGRKTIFFMTSLSGLEGAFGQANYAGSKAGLIGLSKSLAIEGKKYEIEVNAISPAALTDMTSPIIEKMTQNCKNTGELFPDDWKIGSPKEVAQSIYALSNYSKLGTGKIFSLNGLKIEVYKPNAKVSFSMEKEND